MSELREPLLFAITFAAVMSVEDFFLRILIAVIAYLVGRFIWYALLPWLRRNWK